MDQHVQPHEIPSPPKLRRLVASYWKQPESTKASSAFSETSHHDCGQQSAAAPVTPNWELITQGPPASGPYEYDEHYYGNRKERKESSFAVSPPSHRLLQEYSTTSPGSDTLPRNFGPHHHHHNAATTMIHKPTAKPFYKTEVFYEPGNSNNNKMDTIGGRPSAHDDTADNDEMSMGTTLADDSHKLFETVKQAVAQFGHGHVNSLENDNEDDDEELTGFLQQAAGAAGANTATGPSTTYGGAAAAATMMTMVIGHDNDDAMMFQAVTPSPDPIHQPKADRKLPPILPPLHRDEMHGTSRAVHLSKKKSSGISYPPPCFFSTGSSSFGSIPREIIAPVIYPEVVVATHGDREDPMDPRFGIEHPPVGTTAAAAASSS
jgi:hypothetical protein